MNIYSLVLRSPKSYALLLILTSLTLSSSTLIAQTNTQTPIHFESDSMEFREAEQVITASGNVTVEQTSYTFQSDHAAIDIPNKKLKAWGNVIFKDINKNEIRANFLTYNQINGSAELDEAQGSFGPWLFSTRHIERDPEGNFLLEKARLSTCETDFSKYHLYGRRIKIMPKKRLTVQHALFRIGPIPILYLPYYYYPLGEKHLAFQIFPGRSDSEGGFVRTVWGYPITEDTYLKFYLDTLSLRGIGTGGEFDYYHEKVKGSLYGYRINDKKTENVRWNTRLAHWQSITPRLMMQSQINQMSDNSFPNDFFREDFNRVVPDIKSSLALTYQIKSSYFRMVTERKELFNPTENKFAVDEVSLPQIEFNQIQTPLGFLGINKTISFDFINRYGGSTPLGGVLSRSYRQESSAQINLFKTLNFSKWVHLIPKIFVKNNWNSSPQGLELLEPNIQRLGTETTLRQNLSTLGDIDWTYRYTQRLQQNQGNDQGIEDHEILFFTWVRPAPWASVRLDSGYTLPKLKGENLALSNLDKYKPIRSEVSLQPKRNMEIFFREEYILSDPNTSSSHPLSTQAEITLGQRGLGKNYFSLGSSYFSSLDHQFEIRPAARFSPAKNWKVEGSFRTALFYDNNSVFHITSADLVEKEVQSKFEWRCWNFSFLFRERKGVVEILFNLELELERTNREKESHPNREAEWYPWRRPGA